MYFLSITRKPFFFPILYHYFGILARLIFILAQIYTADEYFGYAKASSHRQAPPYPKTSYSDAPRVNPQYFVRSLNYPFIRTTQKAHP